jgi:acetylornithine deacetylase/succinyl-diaminopimelate desuccinylase-like protein
MATESAGRLPRKQRLQQLATAAYIAAAGGIVLRFQLPPPALSVDAPAGAFSATRALRHVEAIAREPHPLGSRAAEPVRAYIVAELKALGLEPEIQRPRDFRTSRAEPNQSPARRDVQNIVARWRGTGPATKKALLLSAHYDSVARGPGAGDDASGVAAILESLRALKAGAQLERDLIILINEGEEIGLFGADVFASEHPWAKDVGVVLNLDARGNSGASYMFETSDGNGWLIAQLASALPHPMATSLTMEVYRLMPNDTDLTIYKHYGMAGLNFAFVGGLSYYHSPDDTPANLDLRTLQHQGENLLAMVRQLGRQGLDDVRHDDVTYTSLLQHLVVIYPKSWVVPLSGCAVAAYIAVVALGVMKGRTQFAEIGTGFLIFLLATAATLIAVSILWLALTAILSRVGVIMIRSDLGRWGMPVSRFDVALLTGSSVVAVGIAATIFGWLVRRSSPESLGLGILGWWLAATMATSLWLPGASYAFLWPLLAILAGQAVAFMVARGSITALLACWLGAVPLLAIHLAILPGLFDGLNLRMAGPIVIPVLLFAGALLPLAGQLWVRRPQPA